MNFVFNLSWLDVENKIGYVGRTSVGNKIGDVGRTSVKFFSFNLQG